MKRGRLILLLVFLGLLLSGIGLYWCLPATIDDLPHPLNGVFRQWHGAFALAGLFSLGQMWAEHIRKHLSQWRDYPDGLLHLLLWLALIVSGYLLYYPPMALESLIDLGQLHWWLGVALFLMLPLHAGRRIRFKRRSRKAKLAATPARIRC